MSENGGTGAGDGAVGGMPAADVKFLVTCLQNTTGGSVSIDMSKVAEHLGYKNPRSVGNKVAAMKKKYDLPLGSSASKGAATPDKTVTAKTPAVAKTPTKNRVTKPSATSSTKKSTPKKSTVKVESGDEEEMTEKEEESDKLAKEEYEKVFGKVESDEECMDTDEV